MKHKAEDTLADIRRIIEEDGWRRTGNDRHEFPGCWVAAETRYSYNEVTVRLTDNRLGRNKVEIVILRGNSPQFTVDAIERIRDEACKAVILAHG